MMKVEEEYCWTITEVAGHSCCDRSSSSVSDLGFQFESLVSYTRVYFTECIATSVRLVQVREILHNELVTNINHTRKSH